MAMFYMQYKGQEKAAKVVEFVAKWLNLCLSTVVLDMSTRGSIELLSDFCREIF